MMLNVRFLRMIRENFRFKRESGELLRGRYPGLTLGEYLRQRGYSRYFIESSSSPWVPPSGP